jgi:hypothetical protein
MQPISKLVFSLFRGTERHEEWLLSCLQGAWPKIVGARMAKACVPAELHRGRLVIRVVDPAWETALAGMEQEILSRVRASSTDEIRYLSLRTHTERQH